MNSNIVYFKEEGWWLSALSLGPVTSDKTLSYFEIILNWLLLSKTASSAFNAQHSLKSVTVHSTEFGVIFCAMLWPGFRLSKLWLYVHEVLLIMLLWQQMWMSCDWQVCDLAFQRCFQSYESVTVWHRVKCTLSHTGYWLVRFDL